MKIFSLTSRVITMLFLLSFVQSGYAEETVYGWQMMSEQERAEHRAKMQSFNTEQERETYRLEHHKRMQQRAEKKGVILSNEPQPRNKGMMQGPGAGTGSGKGQGMGGGGGR
jgi:hypothetical protein